MDEYQNLFYKIEEIGRSPFVKHIGSFSCPEVCEILDEIYNKYQEIEQLVLPVMKQSYLSNKDVIENLADSYDKIPIDGGYSEINIKSDYGEYYFSEFITAIERDWEVQDENL